MRLTWCRRARSGSHRSKGYPDAAGRLRDSLLARTEQATRDMRKLRGKLGGTEGGK